MIARVMGHLNCSGAEVSSSSRSWGTFRGGGQCVACASFSRLWPSFQSSKLSLRDAGLAAQTAGDECHIWHRCKRQRQCLTTMRQCNAYDSSCRCRWEVDGYLVRPRLRCMRRPAGGAPSSMFRSSSSDVGTQAAKSAHRVSSGRGTHRSQNSKRHSLEGSTGLRPTCNRTCTLQITVIGKSAACDFRQA